MKSNHAQKWALYLILGTAAVSVSSCRLGNRVGAATSQSQLDDGVTGFYSSQLRRVQFCATLTTGTTCKDEPRLGNAPYEVSDTMSNPVALILYKGSKTEGVLSHNSLQGGRLPINISGTTSLTFNGTGSFELIPGFSCDGVLALDEQGAVSQHSSTQEISGYPVRGNMILEFIVRRTWDAAACQTALQYLKSCYDNVANCTQGPATDTQENHAYMQDWVDSYIAAGALTANDIPQLQGLSYQLWYD